MPQQTKEWKESFEPISDKTYASQLIEPVQREEIEYETELPAMRPETDFAVTTGYIGISVFTKVAKIGGPIGWLFSTGADCALAYFSATKRNQWP